MSIQQKFFWFVIIFTTFGAGVFHVVDTYFMEIQNNSDIEKFLMSGISLVMALSFYLLMREKKG